MAVNRELLIKHELYLNVYDLLVLAILQSILDLQHFLTCNVKSYPYVSGLYRISCGCNGTFEAIMEILPLRDLICTWAHGALRLFQDRLITREERNGQMCVQISLL
jgi:hypothetical protein